MPPDISLTQEIVLAVVDSVEVQTLGNCLSIPLRVKENILSVIHYDSMEQKSRLIHYWVNFSPFASWNWLAGRLYYWDERTALEASLRYVQKISGIYNMYTNPH